MVITPDLKDISITSHALTSSEVLEHLHATAQTGLTTAEVEKRRAAFQRVGHRSDVDLGHQVAWQVRDQVGQAGRSDLIATAAAREGARQKLERVVPGNWAMNSSE